MSPFTFTLFAPYNKQAALRLKNANVRMFGVDILMEKDESDGYFRAAIDLADGIYHYQFKIQTKSWFEQDPEPALPNYDDDDDFKDLSPEEKQEKTQAYARLLEEIRERNRQRENEATFTEIWYTFVDPYATDVDERGSDDAEQAVGVLIIKNGKRIIDEYEWKYDDCVLPKDEQLVIYELHVGDFSGGEDDRNSRGTFKNVMNKIGYLKELGVNAIELMPIKEYPGNHSCYNPRYHFAIETSYGPTAELKEMIDEMHKNGIRVIMDGVYNHSDSAAPLTQVDHDYWYHHYPKDITMSWGPEWNYNFFDPKYNIWPARKFVGDSIRYVVEEFHMDGIRFDAARQIQSFDFLHWIISDVKKIAGHKPFYCVAEFLPDEPCITNIDGPMDGCWHDSFYWTVRDILLNNNVDMGRLKACIDCRQQGYLGVANVVNYIGNHDHDRMLVELGKQRNIFGEEAFKRVRLGVVLMMTSIGIPMIWMGEEIGEYKEKTIGTAKIDWSLIADRQDNSNQINKGLLNFYRGIIRLREKNKAFFTTNLNFIHEDDNNKVIVYQRWADSGERVVIIANLSENFLARYRVPNMPANGRWHEWTFNYDVNVENNEVYVDIAEHEAKILVWIGDNTQPPPPSSEPVVKSTPTNESNKTT